MVEPGLDKLKERDDAERLAAAPKYVVRSAAEILAMNPEPPIEIWGGMTLTNDVFEVIGASGIGKSRILLNLAIAQSLADTHDGPAEFAGLPVYRGPLRWLLLGTENGIYRYHTDLKRMLRHSSDEQKRVLGERLFMTTLEGDGDSYMATDCEENVEKLHATIASIKPDVVVFDPWGDVCGGSELDDKVIRDTVAVLRQLRRGIKDTLPIIIVNHSRMGAVENMKATGLDAGNFGKNSKALYTISRCVWNLYHASVDPTEGLVGLYNAKRSNGRPYDERCIKLDPEQLVYDLVEGYDPKAAKAQQVIASSGPKQNSDDVRAEKFTTTLKKGVAAILKASEAGPLTTTSVRTLLGKTGVPSRQVDSVLDELKTAHGFESERESGKNGATFWGTPEQLKPIRAKKSSEEANNEG